jgi:hypothetical protein
MVLDSLVFAAEAEVRWLDACEERLARRRAAPVSTASPVTAAPARSAARERAHR